MRQGTLALSERISRAAWDGDGKSCLPYLAADFSFVGPFNNGTGFGPDEFIRYLDRIRGALKMLDTKTRTVRLVWRGERCEVVLLLEDVISKSGKHVASSRSTLVWHMGERDQEPQLVHMHASMPTLQKTGNDLQEFSAIPQTTTAQPAWGYRGARPVALRDASGVRHVLNYDETLYLEASHQYTIVHLPGTSFRVRNPLTTVLEGLPPFFVRVHRSYAVNARLVAGMKGPEVQLVDGSTVRVPAKRTKEMREALQAAAAESALHEESLS